MESTSIVSVRDFLSSTAMAFSNACLRTIFSHSVYLRMASLSFGRNFFTWDRIENIVESTVKLLIIIIIVYVIVDN